MTSQLKTRERVTANFTGNNNANNIIGTADNDSISALGGNDTVIGGMDTDTIMAGAGIMFNNVANVSDLADNFQFI